MRHTYIASDNSTSDAQVLGASGQDVYIYKICFGAATGGEITNVYNSRVATGHASGIGSVSSTNLAWSLTQPTFAAGKDQINVVDFGSSPLQVDGGSVHSDASKVTIIWEPVDEAK